MGVFEEAEAEAGHVDIGVYEVGEVEDGFELLLLVGEAHVAEAKDGAGDEGGGEALEDGDDGLVVVAGDVDAGEEQGIHRASSIFHWGGDWLEPRHLGCHEGRRWFRGSRIARRWSRCVGVRRR